MKIHIVQKGDTLWELSKKYGVDFEELKKVNSQLASPDMIMPGMKIKIPSETKAVKKETKKETFVKEKPKETQMPFKDMSPKPMPVIHEDEKIKKEYVKPVMPTQPQLPMQPHIQMPIIDQDFEFNFTEMAKPKEEVKKEKVKKEVKEEVKEQHVEMPVQPQLPVQPQIPVQPQMPIHQPIMQQPIIQPVPHMMPCCYYIPCPPPPCHHYPMMMPEAFMPATTLPAYQQPTDDCGCGGPKTEMPTYENNPTYDFNANQPMLYANPNLTMDMLNETPYPNVDSTASYPVPPTFPNFSPFQREEDDDN
ncbi:SafA/ExsA family spore coat assembly protein [Oceanobacillus sp. Castelsardo]|uniref:SafA/ExsA family spore coat assembly protein n=1 Tax=Oceanobacillus sp. Castelsardo TaxID=1851204 RepID=UPI000837FB68|nr:SafA/ExsA family spore coat assembly protein [Oceanobacillus sp. Castelsardo]